MRSIPQALLWEMIVKSRWLLPVFFLIANSLGFAFYSAMASLRYADYGSPVIIRVAEGLLVFNTFIFSAGIYCAIGDLRRLYGFPLTTMGLVVAQLLPAAVLSGMQMALTIAIFNYGFHAQWPFAGPILFAMVFHCYLQAILMGARKSLLAIVVMAITGWMAIEALKSGHGGWSVSESHYWTEVTLYEFTLLVAALCLSIYVACISTRADRRGEPFQSLIDWRWVANLWERALEYFDKPAHKFRSPAEAQLWFEWRPKGWLLPAMFSICVTFFIFGGLIALIGDRMWENERWINDIWHFMLGWAGLMSVLAIAAGLVVGLSSFNTEKMQRDVTFNELFQQAKSYEMKGFQASRPIETRVFAQAILRTAGWSVLYTWLIWIALCGLFLVFAWSIDHMPDEIVKHNAIGWALPLSLLIPWIILTHVAIAGLTGRMFRFVYSGIGLMIVAIAASSIAREWLSRSTYATVTNVSLVTFAVLILAVAAWGFLKSYRQRHLQSRSFLGLSAIMIGILGAAILLRPAELNAVAYVVIAAFAALVVTPFAFTPLAIQWNRHR